jgi:peptidoglycan/xylan/chitin deacetylase (PgdA/CDA1 family)
LTAVLGHAPRAFAYPNGNFDARAEQVLKEQAYQVAFLFDHRLTPTILADPLRISRLRVSTTTSLDRFAAIVSGLHPAVHHAQGGGGR